MTREWRPRKSRKRMGGDCERSARAKARSPFGVQCVAEEDAQQHDAEPGDDGKEVDGRIALRREAEPNEPRRVDMYLLDHAAGDEEGHPQKEVEPPEAQKRVGRGNGEADQVKDAELHVGVEETERRSSAQSTSVITMPRPKIMRPRRKNFQ